MKVNGEQVELREEDRFFKDVTQDDGLGAARGIINGVIITLIVLCILGFAYKVAFGQETKATRLTFEWDANTEPDLKGYKLYNVLHPEIILVDIPAGTETAAIEIQATEGHEQCYYLQAYDLLDNEGGPSNIVCKTFAYPPGNPVNLEMSIQIIININQPGVVE